ncbi:MAG: hypothetical protein COY86_02905, partial [Rhodobacterales bacterium CG_4_10_14_0_8_um_filter_70_9]
MKHQKENENTSSSARKFSTLSSSSDDVIGGVASATTSTTLPTALKKRDDEQQEQQQQAAAAAAENVSSTTAAPINSISTHRWFWRELAKDFGSAEKGLAWRPFEEKIEATLEEAFLKWRDEAGPSSVNVCLNKFNIDFDKMQLCSAVDGGSRRSIQRVRVEAGFFWFACEQQGKAAWKFPFDVSCVLEREYISGNSTSF